MPDLIDPTERYEVLGQIPKERDDNSDLDFQNQQSKPEDDAVVMTTNDKDEAEQIRLAGGFVNPDDQQWTVVTGWRDREKEDSTEVDGAGSAAIKKSEVE